jgi:hypothetical protein
MKILALKKLHTDAFNTSHPIKNVYSIGRPRAVIAQSVWRLGYGLDNRGSRVRFPAGAGNFSLHHRVQNGSGDRLVYYPVGTGGSSPGVKRPPSSAEVKECVELYLHSPIRLHGVVLS